MSGFTELWLSQREPYDHAARSQDLLVALRRWRQGREALSIADLGSGTGSNLRALAPVLGGRQSWTLIDHDPALVAAAFAKLRGWAADRGFKHDESASGLSIEGPGFFAAVTSQRGDLRGLQALPLAPADLVTGSALLDLVSREWLERLASACRGKALYFALTFDGNLDFDPEDFGDSRVRDAFLQHQSGDKGFGPAMGSQAPEIASAVLREPDYKVSSASSPWRLGPCDRSLQSALFAGYVQAAKEIDSELGSEIDAWLERRSDLLKQGALHVVGHRDLLALPVAP
jgi:SAM-dependent methyltransferase